MACFGKKKHQNLGGIVTWSMREGYASECPTFVQFESDVERLVSTGAWRHLVARKSVERYYQGHNGHIYVMQTLPRVYTLFI